MQLPKSAILTATVTPVVLLGIIAIAARVPSVPKHQKVNFKRAGITRSVDPAPADTSAPALDTAPTDTSAAGAENLKLFPVGQQSTDSQAPSDAATPAPVTVASAALIARSNPQAGQPDDSTIQNQYESTPTLMATPGRCSTKRR